MRSVHVDFHLKIGDVIPATVGKEQYDAGEEVAVFDVDTELHPATVVNQDGHTVYLRVHPGHI